MSDMYRRDQGYVLCLVGWNSGQLSITGKAQKKSLAIRLGAWNRPHQVLLPRVVHRQQQQRQRQRQRQHQQQQEEQPGHPSQLVTDNWSCSIASRSSSPHVRQLRDYETAKFGFFLPSSFYKRESSSILWVSKSAPLNGWQGRRRRRRRRGRRNCVIIVTISFLFFLSTLSWIEYKYSEISTWEIPTGLFNLQARVINLRNVTLMWWSNDNVPLHV